MRARRFMSVLYGNQSTFARPEIKKYTRVHAFLVASCKYENQACVDCSLRIERTGQTHIALSGKWAWFFVVTSMQAVLISEMENKYEPCIHVHVTIR